MYLGHNLLISATMNRTGQSSQSSEAADIGEADGDEQGGRMQEQMEREDEDDNVDQIHGIWTCRPARLLMMDMNHLGSIT